MGGARLQVERGEMGVVRNQEEERILGGCEVEMGFRFWIRLGLTKEDLYILGLVWVTG